MTTSKLIKVGRRGAVVVLALIAGIGISHASEVNSDYQIPIQAIQQPQTRTVSGTVTDASSGEPIVGAMVRVGENNTSISDAQGQYTLHDVPADATIVVTIIGYQNASVASGISSNVNITMEEDAQMIDDIVVVAYGTQRRETITGAVSSVTSEDILTTKTENAITAIQGKLAGVLIRNNSGQPGSYDTDISIRGFGEPIFVIDGVVRLRNGKQEFARLNQEDIESVTIMKDGAAAVYGMNSGNGVVLVTTKKGTGGRARVSYSGYLSIQMPTGMAETTTAYQDRLLKNEYRRNVRQGEATSWEMLDWYRNGFEGYTDTDWIGRYVRNQAFAHNHNVSVRGGNEDLNYFASLGYQSQDGLLKSNNFMSNQYQIRANFGAKLSRDLSMNFRMSGRMDQQQTGVEPWIWTYKSLIVNDRGVGPYTLWDPSLLTNVGPENKNPEALVSPDLTGYNKPENTTVNAAVEFIYKPQFLPGMTATLMGSLDYRGEYQTQYRANYKTYDYRQQGNAANGGGGGTPSYRVSMDQYKRPYAQLRLNYEKNIGDHFLSAMLAGEIQQSRSDMLAGMRLYDMYTFKELNQVSPTTQTNEGTHGYERYAAFIGRVNYDYKDKYLIEAMVRYDGTYKYPVQNMWALFPSVSAGWRIGEEPLIKDNLSWVNDIKLRASYGMTGTDQSGWYTWMRAYNNNLGQGYMVNGSTWTGAMVPPGVTNENQTWRRNRMFNVGIDLTVLKNLSFSFEWFQRRNTGILATRYADIPSTWGTSLPQENLNANKNEGLEAIVTWRGRAGNDFQYTLSANATLSRSANLREQRGPFSSPWDEWKNNSIGRYGGRAEIYTYDGVFTALDQYENYPLMGGNRGNSAMLPGSYRLNDNNGDGRITSDDRLYASWASGAVNPPLQFGFTVDAKYKSWDLSMTLTGAAMYSVKFRNDDLMGYGERFPTSHAMFLDRWRLEPKGYEPGGTGVHPVTGKSYTLPDRPIYADPRDPNAVWTPGKYPAGRPTFSNTTDNGNEYVVDTWLPPGTHLRLKTVELGYTLPETATKYIGFQSLRIYVSATNLLTFAHSSLRLLDPERGEGEYNVNLPYPLMKSVNFGVNISF